MLQRRRDFEIFGLSDGAALELIRREYRRLAMACHPDRLGQLDAGDRAQATKYMQELNAAYARLTSPDSRARVTQPATRSARPAPDHRRPRLWRNRAHHERQSTEPRLGASQLAPSILLLLLLLVFLALTVLGPQDKGGMRRETIDYLEVDDEQAKWRPACRGGIPCGRN